MAVVGCPLLSWSKKFLLSCNLTFPIRICVTQAIFVVHTFINVPLRIFESIEIRKVRQLTQRQGSAGILDILYIIVGKLLVCS